MQYAFVDNARQEAFPRGKGICPTCAGEMIAKCGNRIVHHWAHAHMQNCDPWWENETPWHREWKSRFPPECREISHVAEDGEIHRADVKTSTGIVIEFQHSAITDEERLARERFYKNVVWVVDGSGFVRNFDVLHMLPAPDAEIAQDIVWIKGARQFDGAARGYFWRISEHPEALSQENAMVEIHGLSDIEKEVEAAYRGHHQFDWIRPRRAWLEATFPVYIDFGGDLLVKLGRYGPRNMPCVQYVSKRKFIHDASVESSAALIATRFYPLEQS